MSREMNKMVSKLIKYDLMIVFIFALILSILIDLKVALIFALGIVIALLNTIASGLILEYSLKNDKKTILILSYIIRILIIIIIALPFLNNLIQLITYLIGYILHFAVIIFYWIKTGKGSD
ncbi:hypothetical protein A500_13780 [Clostridium sartagoforme AAU1]|uniref:ATP synthase subunit I n=1 Tax=Clostridium sartagoforme AAU1 TaxID=1202534 RepID=R9BW10_9CLOT|nr:ATP synthase subunit I [Clostridium sartagoforme]EOR21314.1 hypothetical protein A500_13780 [Clostridium sartagoforme AAU1]